jgi:hypothetical protein
VGSVLPVKRQWLAHLAAALLFAPAAASAAVTLSAQLSPVWSPFANAITADGVTSSLSIVITNSGDQTAHRIDIRMPAPTPTYTATVRVT